MSASSVRTAIAARTDGSAAICAAAAGAVGDIRFARDRVGRGDADVEAGAVEQVAHRGHEPLRQQQHVEEQRADGGHAEDAERRARRLPHEASPREGEGRDHRRASLSPLRRSSAHDAATVATAPSGTAIARQVAATFGVTCTKISAVS